MVLKFVKELASYDKMRLFFKHPVHHTSSFVSR